MSPPRLASPTPSARSGRCRARWAPQKTTACMYAFAPVSLAALHKVDGGRPRPYRAPMPTLVLPAAFCSANLIIYWGGFESTWKLACAMLVGLALFAVGTWRSATEGQHAVRN